MKLTQILCCARVNKAFPHLWIVRNRLLEYFQHLAAVMHIVQAKDVVHVEKHKGASVVPHIVIL
ncbi:hypothetical protein [Massilia putida]|uniref:hypothetical protein n=1 Tax=Massilia putida TaxID=1141883 RepID=UPI0012EB352F|nr:hypothetical protein [Massilia putida]